MKIVTYNIQYTLGRDNIYDIDRIVEEIKGADVIALQEVDRYWSRSGNIDQPAEISKRLPEYYWVFGANCDMHAHGLVETGLPIDNRRRQFGNMILSKSPILSSRNFLLPKYGTIVQHSIQQGILEAVIDTPAGTIRLYSTHLSHLLSDTRIPQIKRIVDIHSSAYGEGGAWCGGHPNPASGWLEGGEPAMPRQAIVLGDFNCDYRSLEYELLCGPFSETHGRLNHREGFMDAWVVAGHEEAEGQTHPNSSRRIDYCFITPDLAPYIQSVEINSSAEGSDHYPVWIELL